MKATIRIALLALLLFGGTEAMAACAQEGQELLCTGVGVNDNDVLFTSGDADLWDTCSISSSAGSVDVQVALDAAGTVWTSAIQLNDQSVDEDARVLATTPGALYWFGGKFKRIRVLQVGASAATVAMRCWDQ